MGGLEGGEASLKNFCFEQMQAGGVEIVPQRWGWIQEQGHFYSNTEESQTRAERLVIL